MLVYALRLTLLGLLDWFSPDRFGLDGVSKPEGVIKGVPPVVQAPVDGRSLWRFLYFIEISRIFSWSFEDSASKYSC